VDPKLGELPVEDVPAGAGFVTHPEVLAGAELADQLGDGLGASGVVEIAPGVLGPRDGGVAVDVVEPGYELTEFRFTQIVTRQVFRDVLPWVVITVGRSD
jgi:hypothetical protein